MNTVRWVSAGMGLQRMLSWSQLLLVPGRHQSVRRRRSCGRDQQLQRTLTMRRISAVVAPGMRSDTHHDAKRRRRRVESSSAPVTGFECGGAEALDRAMTEEMEKLFGYSTFKDGQKEIVSSVLSGQNSLAIFPTGGGKSLTYQLTATMLQKSGLTIIVSPLLALMKDQVESLAKLGLRAQKLDSSLSPSEHYEIMSDLKAGKVNLLYVSPERFSNRGFADYVRQVPIALFAVDEAHCISEWGQSFRPDYLRLKRFAALPNVQRVLCVTATASSVVEKDIVRDFDIQYTFRAGFYRPNLRLLFSPVQKSNHTDELIARLKLPERAAQPSVVYVTTQRQSESLAAILREEGLDAKSYHAGMPVELRDQVQDWFMQSADGGGIVVATIAFGMGIDKKDIRYIYHYNAPKSLQGYSQEIGRAGRDGKHSICETLFCADDMHLLKSYSLKSLPERAQLELLLADLFKGSSVGEFLDISFFDTADEHRVEVETLKLVFSLMEVRYRILEAATPYYSSFKLKVLNKIELPNESSVIVEAFSSRLEHKTKYSYIDVREASAQTGIPVSRFLHVINELETRHRIEIHDKKYIRHRFEVTLLPQDISALSQDLFSWLYNQTNRDLARIDEVIDFVSGSTCHTRSLIALFGTKENDSEYESNWSCGHCTFCERGARPIQLFPAEYPAGSINEDAWESFVEQAHQQGWSSSSSDGDGGSDAPFRLKTGQFDHRVFAHMLVGLQTRGVRRHKLQKNPCFGSMANNDLATLYAKCQDFFQEKERN